MKHSNPTNWSARIYVLTVSSITSVTRQLFKNKVLLMFLFALIATTTYAQTVGGTAAGDDFDGDGIINSIDIDDDNDGILDVDEAPNCFFKQDEWNTAVKTPYVTISSQLTTTPTYSNFAGLTDNGNLLAGVVGFPTAQAQLNKELFRMTFAAPVQLDAIYIVKTNTTQIFSATASTLMLQGTNDTLATWINLLTAAIASPATATNITANAGVSLANSNKFTIATNAAKYKYYRIYGVAAGSTLGGIATEFYFDVNNATYSASSFPAATCTMDTDGDGKMNFQDLDADADGCFDVVEAGVVKSSTTGLITGFVGANGLVDTLESATESGRYKSVYYYDYAIKSSVNNCTDFDGDGVIDRNDLDDDNDGIVDVIESPNCYYLIDSLYRLLSISSDLTQYSTYTPTNAIDGNETGTGAAFATGQNWVGQVLYKVDTRDYVAITGVTLPLFNWALSPTSASTFKLQGSTDTLFWTDLSVPVASTATSGNFTVSNTLAPSTKFKFFRLIGVAGTCGYGGIYNISLDQPAGLNRSALPKSTCTATDSDADGKPNHQDVDSDGDGCYDAVEAGALASSTTGIVAGTYGANGLVDTKETTSESGIPNYAATYAYVTNKSFNFCVDTDGDGISDLNDIDIDNDGVLNALEAPGCYATTKELFTPTFVSSDLALYSTDQYQNAFDNSVSTRSAFATNQDWVDKDLYLFTTGQYVTIAGVSLDVSDWPLSTGTPSSTFKLQGSTDTLIWTDLSVPVSATSVPGTFTVYNTLAPNTRFNFYRLVGVTGKCNYGGVRSLYLNFPANYNESANPKWATCTIDADKDGKLNQYDLDADGDGCSDAIEAGSSKTATSTTVMPTGVDANGNGLLDVYEGTTAGSLNFISNYAAYALNNTLSSCIDSDADGINNVNDLDDDNDGVIDISESPNCFYTAAEIEVPAVVTTELASTGVIANLYDNVTTTTYAFTASDYWRKTIFEITPKYPLQANGLEFNLGTTTTFFPTTAASIQLQGYNGNTWVNLTDSITPPTVVGNKVTINVTKNTATYYKYKLVGLATASVTTNTIAEIKLLATANYNPSYNIKPTCTTDTDIDGKLNHLDLDSDGDGCSDAIEAGSSKTATSTTAMPTGTDANNNGLLDVYEGTTSGILNYVSYYAPFAVSKTLNACSDFDGDGVSDLKDIDDDNDGVLDITESFACFYNTLEIAVPAVVTTDLVSTGAIANLYDNSTTTTYAFTAVDFWRKTLFEVTPVYPLQTTALQFVLGTATTFLPTTAKSIQLQGWNGNAWVNLTDSITAPTPVASVITVSVTKNANIYYKYRLFGTVSASVTTNTIAEVKLVSPTGYDPSYFPKPTCTADNDKDGKLNHKDLDTDADGCSDAIESGASKTATSTTTILTGTDTNKNGLLDLYEGTTAGTINYNSFYSPFAADSTAKGCKDTDGDGVADFLDIDLDNDGVINSFESPTCFFTSAEMVRPATVSSQLVQYSTNVIANSIDAGASAATTYSAFNSGQSLVGKELFRFAANGYISINSVLLDLVSWAISTDANSTFKLQAAGDTLLGWRDLSVPVASTATTGTFTVSNTLAPTDKFKYFRLLGVAGTSGYSGVTNLYFSIPAGYNQNLFAKPTCADDMDGDGKYNYLDLDADGDKCPDAREAGAVSNAIGSDYKITSAVGLNGLADTLETVKDNGIIKYTSIYSTYALNAGAEKCADADNDGITDAVDLDDDNDGVLDIDEQGTCTFPTNPLTGLTFTGNGTVTVTSNTSFTTYNASWATKYSNQSFKLPIHMEWTTTTSGYAMIGLLPVGNAKTVSNWNDGAYKIYQLNGNAYGYMPGAWNFNKTFTSGEKMEIDINSSGVLTVKKGGIQIYRIKAKATDYNLAISSGSSTRTYSNFKLTSYAIGYTCVDLDTDGDGIPNRIDVDSDGDGCNDGVEAGVATKLDVVPFTGALGANGVVDALETAPESGIMDYDNTYDFFAVDKTKIACSDNDNDGVVDHMDLDDDNDGILDIDEQISCVFAPVELSSLGFTGNGVIEADLTHILTQSNGGSWETTYSNETFKLPIHLEWTGNTTGSSMIGLLPVGNAKNISNWNDGAYKVYHQSSNIYGYMPNAWNFNKAYTAGQKIEIDISTTGIVIVKLNGVMIRRFKGKATDYQLAISSNGTTGKMHENVKLTSYSSLAVCVDLDADGDGIPNRFEVDSDNDGCNDAVEGGLATKTTVVPYAAPYGNNGLANTVETAAESGLVNYESTYDIFASNKNMVACDDQDNDGLLNHFDLDDDNDGILDMEEQRNCVYPKASIDDMTFTTNATVAAGYDDIIFAKTTTSGTWSSTYSNQTFKLPIHFEYTTDGLGYQVMLGLIPVGAKHTADNYADDGYKFYNNGMTYYARMPTNWNVSATASNTSDVFSIDINESGVLTAKVNGNVIHRIQAPVDKYQLVVSAYNNVDRQFNNVKLTSWSTAAVCEELDTDKDGLINRLDVDSDNDGCNDAVEGSAALQSTAIPFTGPVGKNGVPDAVEIIAESAEVNYSSSYKYYALNKEDNACNDTDGDGIGDILDVDKDNDGIADYVEKNCTSPLFVNRSADALNKRLSGVLLKGADSIQYKITMSGPAVSFDPTKYDGGNGINFIVNDGGKYFINMDLKLSAFSGQTNSTNIAPIIRTVEFGPSVPFNSPASAAQTQNNPQNIVLTWPGAFGLVTDPDNQLSSHNNGDTVKSGEMLVQNAILNHANSTKPTWKVTMFMSLDSTVYDISASVFGDGALNTEGYGFDLVTCNAFDDDVDGIRNEYDLDSDGDGCSDSYEGGSTKVKIPVTQRLTGAVGTNGLINTLEVQDNLLTKLNYEPKYYYAIAKILNRCADNDNDGIMDIIDVDDDNDGILDLDEMGCGTADFSMPEFNTSPNVQSFKGLMTRGNALASYEMNLVGVGTVMTATEEVANNIYDNFDNSQGGLHYTFIDNDNIYGQTFNIHPNDPTILKKVQFGVHVNKNQVANGSQLNAQTFDLSWSPDIPATVYDPYDQLANYKTGDTLPYGFATITINSTLTINHPSPTLRPAWRIDFNTLGTSTDFFLQTTHKTVSWLAGQETFGISADMCFVDDLDDDGVPNYRDTDSDGDGCSDAFEAAAVKTPGGANQTVPGPFGANGLANSIETNDSQTADITYPSMAFMAYSTVSMCADSDGDGIMDKDDIDDDNDGILDTDEYSCDLGFFSNGYTIKSGFSKGWGGTMGTQNSKVNATFAFGDVYQFNAATDTSYAANYKITDNNQLFTFKSTITPSNGTLSQIIFGPNLDGNSANSSVVNNSQTIKLNWNIPVGGIVLDPDDQLSSHITGQGFNEGDSLVTRSAYTVGASTWKIIIPFNFITKEFILTATHSSNSIFGQESFGIGTKICVKKTDFDGDGKGNAIDVDSDGDGCYDAVEAQSGKNETLSSQTIAGPYGMNGLTYLLESDTSMLAYTSYQISDNYLNKKVLGCADLDADGIPDVIDIDDDNDGILDQVECPTANTPPVKAFAFKVENAHLMWVKNKATNANIAKVSINEVSFTSVDNIQPNSKTYQINAYLGDGGKTPTTDRILTVNVEPVAPYTALDVAMLANEGGNGLWAAHPRNLRLDGGIAGNGIVYSIPKRFYLKENYSIGDTIKPDMRISTAYTNTLDGYVDKVFIKVMYNAYKATIANPFSLKYTWNTVSNNISAENFGFQLLSITPYIDAGPCDYDKDGITDDRDFDSDNDGCPDVREAGHRKSRVVVNGNPQIAGPYGVNGYGVKVESNDLLTAAQMYTVSSSVNGPSDTLQRDYVNELFTDGCLTPFIDTLGPTVFCLPDSVGLQANLNGLSEPNVYKWYRDSVLIAGATAQTYIANKTGEYYCELVYDTYSKFTDAQDVRAGAKPAKPVITGYNPPVCSGVGGGVVLSSNYATRNQWYLNSTIIPGATNKTTYNITTAGNYGVIYTDSVAGCTNRDSINIVLTAPPAAPIVAVTQPTCSVATGTLTVTSPTGANYEYSVDFGAAPNTTGIFAGLSSGYYKVYVKDKSTGCISFATLDTIQKGLPTPDTAAVYVDQPTCGVATGNIYITAPIDSVNLLYSINGSTYQKDVLFKNVAAGIYSITVKNQYGCISNIIKDTVNVAPVVPAAPTVSATAPTCTVPIVTVTVSAPTGTGMTYSIDSINYQTSNKFDSVATGTYKVRAKSAAGCVSDSTLLTIIPAAGSPAAAVVTTTQPTCTVPSGTITVSAPLDAAYTYSIDGTTFQAGTTFSGVTGGSYNVTVKSGTGCITKGSAVVIDTAPATVAAPTVAVTQPTCTVATGTIKLSAPIGTGILYSIDSVNYIDSVTFVNVAPGNYSVIAKATSGCISAATKAVVDTQPVAPVAPTTVVTDPTCTVATGTITVSAPTGTGLTYSVNDTTYQAGTTFTVPADKTYSVTVKNASGCISPITKTTVGVQPTTPATPTIAVVDASCTVSTGTITVTAPTGTGFSYSINGTDYTNTTGTFNTVPAGTYSVTVKDAGGCISSAASAIISAPAAKPAAPIATATTITCVAPAATLTVTAPTGTGITYSLDSVNYQTANIFNGIVAGSHKIWAKNAEGCLSDAGILTIAPAAGSPAAPTTIVTEATCAVSTATITISAPTGTDLTYSVDNTTYQAGTTFTVPAGKTYSVTVKDASGCISAATSVVTSAQPITPAAPTATVTAPNCTVSTGTINVASPLGAGFSYSINGTDYTNTTGSFTALAAGTYPLTVKDAGGCTSAAASIVVSAPVGAPAAPTATATQPTCTLATAVITVSAPTASDITYSINGSTYQASNTFEGVAAGTYNVTAINAAGCTSTATAITINAQPETPVAATVTVTQPTCTVTTGTIVISAPTGTGLTYSIDGSDYSNTTGTFSAIASGNYVVTVKSASGCVSPSANTTVDAQPAVPVVPTVAITQPTCTVETATITVTAPLATGYTYSINGTDYTNTTGTFSGVAAGTTYSVTVKTAAGCTSSAATAVVNAKSALPAKPSVTVTPPTCTVPTGEITVSAPVGSGLTYSIDGSTYQASNTFSGVAAGTYHVTVINASGCVSADSAVTIASAPATPAKATVTISNPTCTVTTGTITVSAPTGSGLTYSINGTDYTNTSGTFTGVAAGATYAVSVKNADGCVGADTSVSIVAPTAAPEIPTVTIVQPTCTVSTATITVTAPTGNGLTYSINGTDYTNTTGIFTGVTASTTYNVTVKSAAGCVSASSSAVVNAPTAGAATPTITSSATAAVCAGTTVTLTSSDATTYQWYKDDVLIGGATNKTYSALLAGSYTVVTTNASGCISSPSAASILTVTPVPTASITNGTAVAFTCGATTKILSAPAGTGNTYEWFKDGVSLGAASDTTGANNYHVTLAGSYSVKITNAAACSDSSIATKVLAAVTGTGGGTSICEGGNTPLSVTAPASYANPTYKWQISADGTTGWTDITAPGFDKDTLVISYAQAAYRGIKYYKVIVTGDVSGTPATSETCPVSVSVNALPTTTIAAAPNDTVCAGTPVVISASFNDDPSITYQWQLSGVDIAAQTANTYTANTSGKYRLLVTDGNGCQKATDSIVVVLNPIPAKPSIVITQPTCAVATATITVQAPIAGEKYFIIGRTDTSATGVFTGLPANATYVVKAISASGCISNTDTSAVVIAQPAGPVKPFVTITQPTCDIATGTIKVTAPIGTGLTYSIDSVNYQDTTLFVGVTPGAHYVMVSNALGCVSADSIVVIAAAPLTPAAATVTVTQPTCTVATGTISVTAPTGSGITYSIDSVNFTNTTGIFNNIAAGTYPVLVKTAAGCVSTVTSVTVDAQPALPVAPTVAVTQPTCATATATITVTAPVMAGLSYSIDGTNYSDTTGIFTNVVANKTYAVTVKTASGCTSVATSAIVNAQPALPAKPSITLTQPTCTISTGTITINAPTGSDLTYSINGTNYQASTTFNGVASGTYKVTVSNALGCTGSDSTVIIQVAPAVPATATIAVTQPTCTLATGTITVTNPTGTGYTYSIDSVAFTNTSGVFSNLAAGVYPVMVKSADGCFGAVSNTVVNAQPAVPTVPTVAITQPTCSVNTATITVTAPLITGMLYSIDGANYTNTIGIFNNVVAGQTYNVTVKTAVGCISTSASAVVNAAPVMPATPTAIIGNATPVIGATEVYRVAPVAGAISYVWTLPNGWTGTSTLDNIVVTVGAANGTITVVANTNTCSTPAVSLSVTASSLPPVAPTPTNGKYTIGDTSNPTTISPTVINVPSGSKVLYCDSLGNNCSTTPPALPNKPGTYIYCIKSLDTVTNLTSSPCKYDTITILPTLKPGNATYESGATNNPKDISGLHSNVTPGSKVLYCDSLGNNCSYTAPTLPTASGRYVYCIKAVDTVSGLTSTPCKYDTITITPGVVVLNDQTYCQGTLVNAINVTTPAGATLNWYTALTDSVPLTYVPRAKTDSVGVFTYFISQTVNGVEGSKAPLFITILEKPAAPSVINGKAATTVGTTEIYSVTQQSTYTTYTWNTPSIWTINSGQGTNSINTTIQAYPNDTSGNIIVTPSLNGCVGDPATLLVIVNAVKPVVPAPPTPINGTYTSGDTSNPATIAPTVLPSSVPSGSKILYCDSLGNNCTTTPPSMPTKPGMYIYCIKSIDTISNMMSTPCKYDTIKILPTLTPANGTYTIGNATNPANISGLYSNLSTGSKVLYCDSLGSNCSYTAPVLPTVPGKYVYCIKAVDTASGLMSTPCKYDTISIVPGSLVLNDQTYCQGTLVNAINVTTPAGATLNWYTATSGGTALTYVPTANTSTAGTITYYISQTVSGFEGPRVPLTLTVLPKPAISSVISGKAATTIGSTEVYSVTAQAGYTYTWNTPSIWTINSGQGTNSINTTIQAYPKDTSGNIIVTPSMNGCTGDPAVLLVIVNQVIPAIPAPPTPINGTYTSGDTSNPVTIAPTVLPSSVPSGSKILYCDSLGNNCTTTPPTMPTKPGVYIYCIKSIDTISNMMSTPCKYDTIKISPTLTPANGTFTLGNATNPANISGLYSNLSTGSKVLYCDSLGNNCSYTAPLLPTTPGKYVYCIKAVDTASGLMSTPCKYDTITILPGNPVLNSQTYCQGTLVNAINVTAPADAKLNWYTAASGGVALTYVPTANTSIVGVTTYYISQTINGVEGSRSPFTITVLPKPTTPAVITGKSATTVGSTEVYSVAQQLGYTYTWNTPSIWTINSGQGTNSINTTIQAYTKDTSGNILLTPSLNGCAGDPAVLLVIVNQVIPAIPAPPSPTNGKYTAGDSTNPKNISPTVNPASVPSGSKILYCDSLGNNCSTVPPTLPTKPGVYIYCIKSIDTISNMMSTPCKYDTITILPPAPKPIHGSYTSGDTTNPATIAPTVINVPQGSKVLYCDSMGNNCSYTAPALPTTPGRYIYCVKSVDTASGLMSAPCKYDTIIILPPVLKVDLRKTVDAITATSDGNYLVRFKIKVTNRMSVAIDSVVVQDDLDAVLGSSSGYKVSGVTASGTLVKNDLYNGSSVIDLVTLASTLGAGKSDSVLLSVLVKPNASGGQYANVAKLSAKSPFGNITEVRSDDPTVNPTDTAGITNRDATPFVIPAVDVVIPGGFSPNKDGVDDEFKITAPADSKVNLMVFNRWGNAVFKSENYDNKWDGKGQSGSFLGEYVQTGTYFYLVTITYGTGEVKKFAGPLLIVR